MSTGLQKQDRIEVTAGKHQGRIGTIICPHDMDGWWLIMFDSGLPRYSVVWEDVIHKLTINDTITRGSIVHYKDIPEILWAVIESKGSHVEIVPVSEQAISVDKDRLVIVGEPNSRTTTRELYTLLNAWADSRSEDDYNAIVMYIYGGRK